MLALALLVSTQPAAADKIAGVRAGASVASASVDVSQTFDEDNITGFAGSAFVQLGLGVLTVQPEASYIQKGVKDAASGIEAKFDYFELAALLKAGLPVPVVKPHLFGGIAADWEVGSDLPQGLETSNTDWNVLIGADVMFELGQLVLVADGRYAVGLKDIAEASDVVSDLKNRAWIFSAGLGTHF
jgi:hypothetical protein